jgi:hypothetical protein
MNNSKVEFNIGEPVELKLLTDEPITGTSQYGHWNLYPVLNDNEVQSFFAPANVVDFISKKGLVKNSVISVTKEIKRNGRKIITDYSIEVLANGKATTRAKNGTVKQDKKKAGAKLKPEFVQLREAIIGAVNELFQQRQFV